MMILDGTEPTKRSQNTVGSKLSGVITRALS